MHLLLSLCKFDRTDLVLKNFVLHKLWIGTGSFFYFTFVIKMIVSVVILNYPYNLDLLIVIYYVRKLTSAAFPCISFL